jgi:stress-induced morphogen
MKTTNYIIIATLIALLVPAVASANVYEDRLKEAFDDIINAVPLEDLSQMHTTYTDPETGVKEGQLDVYKFTIAHHGMHLIDAAREVYNQVNDNSNAEVYTLQMNDKSDWSTQGYRLYYTPDETIVVGLACDHCCTVAFFADDDKHHRKTYTIEWDEPDDSDSIKGRIINTYAPIRPKSANRTISSTVVNIRTDELDKYMEQFQNGMEEYQKGMEKYQAAMEKAQGSLSNLSDNKSLSLSFSSSNKDKGNEWMKKILFYLEKVQEKDNRHLYLSKLYELCKDTEGLDQIDLKIGMRQLASIYKQLKGTNKLKEHELLFLESMVDLLQSKINK